MMTYKTVREVLEQVSRFHEELGRFYERAAGESDSPRTKLLLDYLSRYRERHEKEMQELEKDTNSTALDVWLQYTPEFSGISDLSTFKIHSRMTIEDVFQTVVEFHNAMIGYYEHLSQLVSDETAADIFARLAEMTRQEKTELAFSLNTLQDI